ncbi:MAG: CdaR family protein [bacterium]
MNSSTLKSTVSPWFAREDWVTWVIALVLAIGLWSWVQVSQPRIVEKHSVALEVVPNGNVAAASVLPREIDVMLEGKHEDISAYWNRFPVARLDLSRAAAGTGQRFPLTLSEALPAGLNATLDPPAWLVDLQPRISASFAPVLEPINELQEGLHLDDIGGDPDKVVVDGPEMRVREVANVVFRVDMSQFEGRSQQTITFIPVDQGGNAVPFVTPEPAKADVTFYVQRKSEQLQVPIVPRLINEPAPGYMTIQQSVSPDVVTISGQARVISAIPNIYTEPVDISNLSSNLTTTVKLVVPPGSKITIEPKNVRVTIRVQKLPSRRQIAPVPITFQGQQERLRYKLEPAGLTLGVEGDSAILTALTEDQFRAILDVKDFAVGKHDIAVERVVVQTPSDVTVTRREPIQFVLTVTAEGA